MIKRIIFVICAIVAFILFKKLKKNSNNIEYKDKTIKNYKRWHK